MAKAAAAQLDDSAYRVEALAKGLHILTLFSAERRGMRLKEIVELTGLPMPTAFRLVATLVVEGFLERLPDGVVRPGTAVLRLGFAAIEGLDLVETSTPTLRDLADAMRQTVNLGVLSGSDVVYVARLYSNALVTANIRVGSSLPAVVTSMGKLLLAYLPPKERAARINKSSFEGTWGPNAVRTMTALGKQIERIRTDGYAVQDEEVARGLRSIAAPVRAADGTVIAAINIAVPSADFTIDELIATARDPILAAARRISIRLGARL